MLKSSVRHGCSPNAGQVRCTLVGEIPTRRASSRLDQCVAPSGTSSKVRTTTSSTWASLMVRGTPGRGAYPDRKSTRLKSSHSQNSYAVFCPKTKTHMYNWTNAEPPTCPHYH